MNFNNIINSGFWFLDNLELNSHEKKIKGQGIAFLPQQDQDFAGFIISYGSNKYLTQKVSFGEIPREKKAYWGNFGRNIIKHFDFIFEHDNFLKMIYEGFGISFGSKKTLKPFNSQYTRYYIEDQSSVPAKENIARVAGNGSLVSFRMVGYSAFVHLDSILGRYFDKSFSDFSKICDWGCGCGRLTRYFTKVAGIDVTGMDIDGENLKWCQQNLPCGQFRKINTAPPLPIEGHYFDLIIGISVFTHLIEERQFKWLKELKRVTHPEGILLLTINSNLSWAINKTGNTKDLIKFNKKGIIDSFPNNNLGDIISNQNDYVNTFHTHEYILKKWKDYFNIIDIVKGGIGGYQDLVVIRNS